MSKIRIAITGSIGSGKSTACNIIKSEGFDVFDCDAYNAFLLEEGQEGNILIKKYFPECIENGKVNKKILASIVFNNIERKQQLENILHPLIINKMLSIAKNCDVFFAEVPLLFENNLESYFDVIFLVVCDENIAIERLKERGFSVEESKGRLNNQMSVAKKIERATEIIYNNEDLFILKKQIIGLLDKYVR